MDALCREAISDGSLFPLHIPLSPGSGLYPKGKVTLKGQALEVPDQGAA
jgi:hypothetical protein